MAVFAAAATISSHPTFSYGCSRVTSIDCRFRTRAVLTHRPKDLEQAASASVENGKFHTRSSVENPRFRNGSLVENGRVANGSPCFSLTITKTALDDDDKMEEGGRPDINDYVQWSKRMVESTKKDGGPPRWFSPVDCGGTTCYQWRSSSDALPKPLFLYIPGIDGVGLGLISQHQRLGKIFDIWCLHIPVTNRMPFKDMVQLVETTVKAEKYRSPDRPIYLAGESIGACLALAVAARNPDIDLILLLANPATSFSKSHLQSLIYLLQITPTELLLGVPYILGIFTGDPFRLLMDNMEKGISIQQIVQELPESFAALLPSFSALADILPGETILWKLQMLQSASSFVNCRLSSIKADVLILFSGRDNLLPSRDEAKRLSDILPSCRVRNFRDSGPTLLMEKGFDLVTIIKGAGFFRLRRNMDYVLDYMPPTSSEFKQLTDSYRWFTMVTSPVMFSTLEDSTIVRGLSGIPCKGPVVFVSYHMLMGMDLVPLIESFFSEKNIVLRGMAHPMLFGKAMERETYDPSFNDAVRLMGGVPVTGTNIFKLLSTKSHILLFPGGVREALHRKDEDYKLFWPSRSEFVRMAARFGAKIVPFGVVGEDDLVDVILDYNDQVKIPLLKDLIGQLNDGRFERLRTEISDDVAEQDIYMPALLPKVPGRLYYLFGKPIETEGRRQELRNKEKADELYVHVKSEVERHIAYLKKKREKDPYRTLFSRMVYQATHGFTSQVPTFNI